MQPYSMRVPPRWSGACRPLPDAEPPSARRAILQVLTGPGHVRQPPVKFRRAGSNARSQNLNRFLTGFDPVSGVSDRSAQ